MDNFRNYAKYGKIGRFADLLCQMDWDGYLEPFCKKNGRDYDKYKTVIEVVEPFFMGDCSQLENIKQERKAIKKNEKGIQEIENELATLF